VVGLLIGGLIGWLISRIQETPQRAALQCRLAAAEELARQSRLAGAESRAQMADTFKALATDALRESNEAFLQVSRTVLEKHHGIAQNDLDKRRLAIEEMLKPLASATIELERQRQDAYSSIRDLVKSLSTGQDALSREARALSQALRTPNVRGRWGEATLKRVAELAGMVEYCDFTEQESNDGPAGKLRPDMVVHLPNKRRVVVDAKTSLDAYLRSIEADTDEMRDNALRRHARQVAARVDELSAKAYWSSLDFTPEFVVLFLPGEPFLAAALQHDPALLDKALASRVVPATPSTLIALLHAVAYGWKQEQMAENAMRVSAIGKELYERLAIWTANLDKVGKSLGQAVQAYNDSVGGLEHRVLVSARRMKEMGISTDREIPVLEPKDIQPRHVTVLAASMEVSSLGEALGMAEPLDGRAREEAQHVARPA